MFMHWIIQKNLFKPVNYHLLIDALNSQKIEHTSVFIPNGTFDLEPEVNPAGRVYVCGAIKLKKIAEKRDWLPGSFLTKDFRLDKWIAELGSEILNKDAIYGKFNNIDVDHMKKFFIRPLEDNKVFDGMIIDSETMRLWRKDPNKKYLLDLDVVVCSLQDIYREYRLFVVQNEVITGSVYKIANKPQIAQDVEQSVIDYVNRIISKWTPSDSFVIDVCLTKSGYKIIEFNNINSSGFYSCDVSKYVEAIQRAYG